MDARFEITEARMEAKFERGFRQTIVTTASLMVSEFIATSRRHRPLTDHRIGAARHGRSVSQAPSRFRP